MNITELLSFILLFIITTSAMLIHYPKRTATYCDADYCANSIVELQQFHDQTPWSNYHPEKVTITVE